MHRFHGVQAARNIGMQQQPAGNSALQLALILGAELRAVLLATKEQARHQLAAVLGNRELPRGAVAAVAL